MQLGSSISVAGRAVQDAESICCPAKSCKDSPRKRFSKFKAQDNANSQFSGERAEDPPHRQDSANTHGKYA
jgi:hypothetical protein